MTAFTKRLASTLFVASTLGALGMFPVPGLTSAQESDVTEWSKHALKDLERKRSEAGGPWLEFLDHPTLSSGIYVLEPGDVDHQKPHPEDEVYYVLDGKAQFTCNGEEMAVKSGDVLYVAAKADHRFHAVEETLRLLVFFSKAKPT